MTPMPLAILIIKVNNVHHLDKHQHYQREMPSQAIDGGKNQMVIQLQKKKKLKSMMKQMELLWP